MSFFRNRKLFVFLIGIIVLVVLIGYSLQKREHPTAPEQVIIDSVGWVQNIIYTPIKYVTDIYTNIGELKNTYQENQLLKEKISQYKTLLYDNQELEADNASLRKILEKTESIVDFNPIQATVTSRSPERWIEQITINKGKTDGVKPNMAVITAEGMVGKVQSTSNYTSTVQLLTGFDEFNRISATVHPTDDEGKKKKKGKKETFGLVESYDKDNNALLFRIIDESEKNVNKGDLIISSGMGGVFPAGLLIGTVEEVVPDQYGLTSTALVKPAADMYKINHVIVVDRLLSEEEDQEEEEEE